MRQIIQGQQRNMNQAGTKEIHEKKKTKKTKKQANTTHNDQQATTPMNNDPTLLSRAGLLRHHNTGLMDVTK